MDGTTPVVTAVFGQEEAAAHAVDELVEAHFDPQIDLRVTESRRHEREEVPVRIELRIARGAAFGAAAGALLFTLAVALSGISHGPLTHFAGGTLYAVLEGAFLGAAVGFGAGALLGIDLLRVRPQFDEVDVPHPVVCVGVRARGERARRARRILEEAGARHFTCAGARDRMG